MGRPPSNGAPSFRFHPAEVAQMDVILQEHEGHVPPRDFLVALAHRFSQAPERAGKSLVQMKQVWNWFQNRRYALRAKLVKSPGKPSTSLFTRNDATPMRYVLPGPHQMAVSSGPQLVRSRSEPPSMEFEGKSARDGAWYDVLEFLSHRYIETGNPEVLVYFSGFAPGEDEWVNIRKHIRQRSLPCELSECVAVLPGDLILCFQEGKEHALYFDAHVLDAQRRRHDIRGCRCRFLVRYDHDQSEEIVPLRKICRRPETDYRLQQLHATNEASTSVTVKPPIPVIDLTDSAPFELTAPNPSMTVSEPQTPVLTRIESSVPNPTPVPEQNNPVSSLKKSQIPDPVTDPNKNETDNSSRLLSGHDMVVASDSTGSTSVPVPIKAENENSDPVTVPLSNVGSIDLGTTAVEADTQASITGPVVEASNVIKTEKAEDSNAAVTVASTGNSVS